MANRQDIKRMKKFLMGTHAAEAVEVAEQLRDAIFGKNWSDISDVDAQKIVVNKHELGGVQLKLTQISENFMERTEDTIYSEAAEKDLGMAYGYIHAAWELLQAAKLMLDGVLKDGSLEEEESKE